MSVLQALVAAQGQADERLMRSADYAANAWGGLMERRVYKAAGQDLINLMESTPPDKDITALDVMKIAQKWKLSAESMQKLMDHMKASGALDFDQKQRRFAMEEMRRKEALAGQVKEQTGLDLPTDVAGDVVKESLKPKTPKAPTVHTFTEGDRTVEKQWDEATQTWVPLSSGPRYKPTQPDSGQITPKEIRTTSIALRKEFNSRPEIKEYNMIQPKFAAIEKALEQSKKTGKFIASDQALITLFNKLTDPNSVVRESEYARMALNMPLTNAILGKAQKVISGGAGLTKDERQQIVDMAKMMKQAYQEQFDIVAMEYEDYAKKYDIDPELVIGKRRKSTVKVINW